MHHHDHDWHPHQNHPDKHHRKDHHHHRYHHHHCVTNSAGIIGVTGSEQEDLKRCQEAIQLTWLLVSGDHDDQDNFSSLYVDFKHKLSSKAISEKVLRGNSTHFASSLWWSWWYSGLSWWFWHKNDEICYNSSWNSRFKLLGFISENCQEVIQFTWLLVR